MTNEPRLTIGADGFTLPLDAQTQTFAILAKRGVGKTYAGMVLAEEMLGAGLAVVAIDPVGVWWGLRSAADGEGPGLPVAIFGGEHGDVAITVESGELVADVVIDDRLSCVLDLSLLRKGEQKRFVRAFAERLYHRNREALHVIIDEADAFAPQRVNAGDEPLLGAIEDLVRRGRARGIGMTLITQRAAVLNKNVLTQIEVLLAMRVTSPQDRAALGAWVEEHGDRQQAQTMLASLASLPVGTAWCWSPGWLDVFERIAIRRRRTFDSSATPIAGRRGSAPATLAAIDLGALRARIAAATDRAVDVKPGTKRRATIAAPIEPTHVEIPVISAQLADELRGVAADLARSLERGTAAAAEIAGSVVRAEAVARLIAAALARVEPAARPPRAPAQPREDAATSATQGAASETHALSDDASERARRAWSTRRANSEARSERAKAAWQTRRTNAGASDVDDTPAAATVTAAPMKDGMRRILVALHRVGRPLVRAELRTIANVTRAGTLGDYLRALGASNYIVETPAGVELAPAGATIVAAAPTTPPATAEILELHRSALKAGQYRILELLVGLYPRAAKRAVLGAQANVTRAGTLGDYVRGLKNRGLIVETASGAQAAPILFVATRA